MQQDWKQEQNINGRMRQGSAGRSGRARRRRKKQKQLAMAVVLLAAASIIGGMVFSKEQRKQEEAETKTLETAELETAVAETEASNGTEALKETEASNGTEAAEESKMTEETGGQETLFAEETVAAETDAPEAAVSGEGYDYSAPVPESEQVTSDYFNDAVFIGDSRTEGLILNTGLNNAIEYTHKGLMVDTVFTKPVINIDGIKVTVMDALKTTQFGKVYIMLGINETGWPYNDVFINKYAKVIDAVREINPEAQIYVQQILPVSQEVSATHSYIKNEKIAEYNALIQEMAKEKQVYFVAAAEAVVGADGALPEDAATDGIHLKKEYCVKWLNYLESHTVAAE